MGRDGTGVLLGRGVCECLVMGNVVFLRGEGEEEEGLGARVASMGGKAAHLKYACLNSRRRYLSVESWEPH